MKTIFRRISKRFLPFRIWWKSSIRRLTGKNKSEAARNKKLKILYKFASRSRPERFFRTIDNITRLASQANYQILATLDSNDESMNNQEVHSKLLQYPKVKAIFGSSKNKIDAINHDMNLADPWDIVVNMSDDMVFIEPDFDIQIIEDFEREGLDVLMHYPDNEAGAALITLAIMGKDYYNRFGYIYNPEYKSLFCDNEQQEVAKILGRYRFVNKRIFNHYHPAWGLEKKDALYLHTDSFWKEDESTFERRKKKNFDLA